MFNSIASEQAIEIYRLCAIIALVFISAVGLFFCHLIDMRIIKNRRKNRNRS